MRKAALVLFTLLTVSFLQPVTGQAIEDVDIDVDTLWEDDHDIDGTVYVYNGSTLSIRNCTVNATSLDLKDGATLVLDNATINIDSIDGENSTISINDCLITSTSEITLVNGSIDLNGSEINGGIVVWHGTMEAYNSTIYNWDAGLAIYGNSTIVADNMHIYDAGVAIWMLWSSGSLSNITINNSVQGVAAQESYVYLENSVFTEVEDGVVTVDAVVDIEHVTLEDCALGCGPSGCGVGGKGYGISSWSSTINASYLTSQNNIIGVYAHNSTIHLENSTIDDNVFYGIQLDSSLLWANMTIFSDNPAAISSLYKENHWPANLSSWGSNTFLRNEIAYSQVWEVFVNVVDDNDRGVYGAHVVAEGVSTLGYGNHTEVTDFYGLVDLNLPTYFYYDNGTRVNYDYSLNISKKASNATSPHTYNLSQELNLTGNKELYLTLPIVYPNLECWVKAVETSDDSNELLVRVEVNNTGQAAAFDAEVRLIEEKTSGFKTILGTKELNLSAGETRELVFIWTDDNNTLPVGSYNLIVEVDPDLLIDEGGEEDNVHERVFKIQVDDKGFPITEILGIIALGAGFIIFLVLFKRQKPDIGMRV